MRTWLDRIRRDKAQAIIFFVGTFSIIMVIGAIVVDFGLWFSERRGAQKDADAAALAGAQAYVADLADTDGAFVDAVAWAVKNGVDQAEIDGAPTSDCSDGNSCIQVGVGDCREDGSDSSMPWVEAKVRHGSRSLFASIFELVAPDIGGVARACVGSALSLEDLSPFGVETDPRPDVGEPETGDQCGNDADDDGDGEPDDGCPLSDCLMLNPDYPDNCEEGKPCPQTIPVYGAACSFKTGAQGGVSGQRGALTIHDPWCWDKSASYLRDDMHYDSPATCTIGNEVNTKPGNIPGLVDGLEDRLSEELLPPQCDQMFHSPYGLDDYDDFDEVFSLPGAEPGERILPDPDHLFSENTACRRTVVDDDGNEHNYQPRALNLILIDKYEGGEQTATIVGFAAFYVIGCIDTNEVETVKDTINEDGLTNISEFLNRCEHPTGHDEIVGVFVQTLQPSGNVGDPSETLPLSIVLVK